MPESEELPSSNPHSHNRPDVGGKSYLEQIKVAFYPSGCTWAGGYVLVTLVSRTVLCKTIRWVGISDHIGCQVLSGNALLDNQLANLLLPAGTTT
jgi:hypothetical protein